MERGRRVREEAPPPQPQHMQLQTKCLWSTKSNLRGWVTTATTSGFLSDLPDTQHPPPYYTQGSICANWAWATFSKAPGGRVLL